MQANSLLIARRFQIENLARDLLGQGGMGAVYLATDMESGARVAVKALHANLVADHPDLVQRFKREGEALRQLNHPNIVKMLAAVQENGQHYLVMEYVQGGSLQTELDRSGPLPVERLVEIALDLADAITRAHRLGIIHRDLKPANVLLAQDGAPRLTDFGLAHIAGSNPLTEAGMILGTLDYLSPEACRNEGLSESSDIWAFGVLLFTALTGRLPFPGETIAARLNAILNVAVPDLAQLCPQIPDGLADLIYRMLEKDPARRISSVRLVGVELEALWKQHKPGSTIGNLPQLPRFATPPGSGRMQHNLPPQSTPFIGREAELVELDRLLGSPATNLVTILGMGGAGKTRLALEAGRRQLERFTHGVYFVPLAPLSSPEGLAPAIAQALSFTFREGRPPLPQLFDYLADKRLLLILDNFEHLLAGVTLVPEILRAAPSLQILVTSRQRLEVQDEQLFHLSGMDFPEWETPADALHYSAVKLFLSSARRVRPEFELAAEDLKFVARICRLVQGLPLGIVLAAAWIEMLSPAEVAEEIERSLDFLSSETRDLPERHHSLRAVFDYSWQMLSPREQELFQNLSIFQGGFDRQAAQEVCGAGLRELMNLNNKSLIHRTQAGRYEVHDLLNQYAAEKREANPQSSQALKQRHSQYYCAQLHTLAARLTSSRRREAYAAIEAEGANARAAWEWAVRQRDLPSLSQAIEGLTMLHIWSSRHAEGEASMRLAAEALADLETPAARKLYAHLLSHQAHLAFGMGKDALPGQLLELSQAVLQEPVLAGVDTRREQVYLLQEAASYYYQADIERSTALAKQCILLAEALNDPWNTALAHLRLGWNGWASGDHPSAQQHFDACLALTRANGLQTITAGALRGLGYVFRSLEEYEKAIQVARESCIISQEMGDRRNYGIGVETLAHSLLWAGQLAEACTQMDESVRVWQDLGGLPDIVDGLIWSGLVHMYAGDYAGAQERVEAGLARSQQLDHPLFPAFAHLVLGHLSLVHNQPAQAEALLQESLQIFQQATAHYEKISALGSLAFAALGIGQPAAARERLRSALETAAAIHAAGVLPLYILPAFTRLLLIQGQAERAVEFYTLAKCSPLTPNSRWHEDLVGKYVTEAIASLPPEVVAAAQERGQARSLTETAAALLAEL